MWFRNVYLALVVVFCLATLVKNPSLISENVDATVLLNGRAYMSVMIPCTRPNIVFRENQQFGHSCSSKISRKREVFHAVSLQVL